MSITETTPLQLFYELIRLPPSKIIERINNEPNWELKKSYLQSILGRKLTRSEMKECKEDI
jgi:hypothetical protein